VHCIRLLSARPQTGHKLWPRGRTSPRLEEILHCPFLPLGKLLSQNPSSYESAILYADSVLLLLAVKYVSQSVLTVFKGHFRDGL
jgi:hypothetical protein